MGIQTHFLTVTALAFGALAVLIVLSWWAFSPAPRATDRRRTRSRPKTSRPSRGRDYGLLVPVAQTRTAEEAEHVRRLLDAVGIRATVGRAGSSAVVLVFPTDVPAARDHVGTTGV